MGYLNRMRNRGTTKKLSSDKKLSPDQKKAFDIIKTHDFIFLTGKAGTGKSFLIDYLRENMPNCAVTATTGIAAQLIKGQTVHSFLGIIPNVGVIDSYKADIRVRGCKTLIVDEVSMANSELLSQIFKRFEIAEHQPRLVLSGDFSQLPPVDGDFAFTSEYWPKFYRTVLTKIHRQTDLDFIAALNDLREGKRTSLVENLIQERSVTELPDDCTKLFPRKYQAEEVNNRKLDQLPSKLKCSEWTWTYVGSEEGKEDTAPTEGNARFPKRLLMKEGARVCLLNNTDNWVNGSTGFIVKINSNDIEVKLDNGRHVVVGEADETIYGAYGNPLYKIYQYPMMLAWGLTIHKSQGMSLDRVGVYLNSHFACGQTYVAFSRAKTKEGLFLQGNLTNLQADQRALKLMKEDY